MTGSERDRYRLSLTPAGAGVFSLFFPGLLIAAVARERLLLAVTIGAGIVLLANLVAARLALGTIEVGVVAPTVASVGQPVELQVALRGSSAPLECAVTVVGAREGWSPARAPAVGPLVIVPATRTVSEHLPVQVRTAVPFGLTSWTRQATVGLAQPLHVAAPAIATAPPLTDAPIDRGLDRSGEPAGVRPYIPGDSQRDVHWPSVARTRTLLVRDRHATGSDAEVTVVVDGSTAEGADQALGRARSVVETMLRSGRSVSLVTAEPATVIRVVNGYQELLRRLARVAPTRPTWSGEGIVVDSEGARWQSGS